jgi:hypothetical protein
MKSFKEFAPITEGGFKKGEMQVITGAMNVGKSTVQESLAIATIIRNQIKAINSMALMSWGAKDFVSFTNLVQEVPVSGPGLQFEVHGPKLKGKIIIGLNGNDLYDIAGITVNTRSGANFGKITVKGAKRDVPAENLVQAIDDIVG